MALRPGHGTADHLLDETVYNLPSSPCRLDLRRESSPVPCVFQVESDDWNPANPTEPPTQVDLIGRCVGWQSTAIRHLWLRRPMFDPTPIYDLLANTMPDQQPDSPATARPASPSGEAAGGHHRVQHAPRGRHAKQDDSAS